MNEWCVRSFYTQMSSIPDKRIEACRMAKVRHLLAAKRSIWETGTKANITARASTAQALATS